MPQVQGFNLPLEHGMGGAIIYVNSSRQGDTWAIYPIVPHRVDSVRRMAEEYLWLEKSNFASPPLFASVVQRGIAGQETYAAVFPSLPAGLYLTDTIHEKYTPRGPFIALTRFDVFAGHITEVDLR